MEPSIVVCILFLLIVVALVRELLPIGVVGLMIPLVLVAFGLMEAGEAMSFFVNETVVLIACVYVMADALTQVGIADKIGSIVIRLVNCYTKGNVKKTENIVILLIMAACAVSGLFLPRYGVTGAFMAVCIAIAKATKISRTKLLLALAMGANIWGNNTLMSTPPNMLANGVLEECGAQTFGFFEFGLIGVPIAVIGSIILIILKNKNLPANVDESLVTIKEDTPDDFISVEVPKWRQIATCIVFLLFFICIVMEDQIGIPGYITGIFFVALLIAMKLMTEKQVCSSIAWDMPAFFGGILAFGKAMETSGASDILANEIVKVIGNSPSPYFITGTLFTTAALLTQFMSNTGAAGILFPIAIAIANKLNADPRAVIMAITMGCGASFMTPMATVSNVMVMAAGEIKFKDFVVTGAPLMIGMIIVCTVGIPLIWPFY